MWLLLIRCQCFEGKGGFGRKVGRKKEKREEKKDRREEGRQAIRE